MASDVAYTPTTWNAGVAPGISAAELNRIESGVSALATQYSAHNGGNDTTDHPEATSGARGFMAAADKSKLDGIASGAQVNDTAAQILAKLITVDGAGSGLDADLLDGQSSAAFATSGHTHTYLPLAGGVLTGAIRLPAGSAAAPSITFTIGSNNDGIFNDADGYIKFSNNGDNNYAFGPGDFTMKGRAFMPDLLFDNTASTVRFISGGEIKQAFSASSIDGKRDVADWSLTESRLSRLRPRFFRYRPDHPLGGAERWGSEEAWQAEVNRNHGGLILEEARDVIPDLCHGDGPEDGIIAYEALLPELIADYLTLRQFVLDRVAA